MSIVGITDRLHLTHQPDPQVLLKEAGLLVSSLISEQKKHPILLLASGGSALGVLEYIQSNVLSQDVTIGMIDERYSTNPTINNFLQLTKTSFFARASKSGCGFIDSRVEPGEGLDHLAQRLEDTIRAWKSSHSHSFTISILGIGEDGHTAGIMPCPENPAWFADVFDNPERWVVGYDATGKNPHPLRVTVTLSFLKHEVDVAIVYAVGTKKQHALHDALLVKNYLAAVPASIIPELKHVMIFTDIKTPAFHLPKSA